MTSASDLVSVRPTSSLDAVARAFQKGSFHHLPVTSDDGFVGIIHKAHLQAHGAVLNGSWHCWSTLRTAEELLTYPPIIEGAEQHRTTRILRALLNHTAVALVDANQHLTHLLTDTDGLQKALDVLPRTERAFNAASQPRRVLWPQTPAWAARREMDRREVRHLLVEEGDRPIGVVSIRDLEAADVDDRPDVRVQDVLRDQVLVTAPQDVTLIAAATLMAERGIGCLPLVDAAGSVSAVIDRRDVIRAALDAD